MHYALYIIGVLLLILPAGLLTSRWLKIATLHQIAKHPRQRLGWLHWVNLADLVRAWAGLTLVRHACVVVDSANSFNTVTFLMVAAAVLVGLGLQLVFHSAEEDDLVAPVAYAIGLVFAVLPPQLAFLVLPLGFVAALAFGSVATGFFIAAAVAAVIGYMFQLPPIAVATAGIVLFTPALSAGLCQRRLVLTIRRGPLVRSAPVRDFQVQRPSRESF